ncbi:MAG: parallel beta-helix domain-containing protein [Bacteroidota bacterium]
MKKYLLLLIIGCFIATISAQEAAEKALQTQFIMVEDGGTIEIEAGKFTLKGSLWLDGKKNITIKGAGIDKTFLSFKGQSEGAEGIKVTNAQNITIQDLTVLDAKGDAIKTQDVAGISFLNVRTEWTGRPKKTNGAYGLYPVQCSKVLIDGCEAIGASDAGIYVGQSEHIIVRNCNVYRNVAGIEIENSTDADVYNNVAKGNTGGILVFDLPGLIKKNGGNVRVFKNEIRENNFKNFAPPGNSVSDIPPGTGVMVLAAADVEVFDNQIINNKTLSTGISSYYITERTFDDDGYDPYTYRVSVHDNVYERKKSWPSLKSRFGKLIALKFKRNVPHIIYDGIPNKEHLDDQGNLKSEYQICVRNNKNESFGNLDAENGFKNLNQDLAPFNCERENLPEVEEIGRRR